MKESFTAFGNRRSSCTWSGPPTSGQLAKIKSVTRRGYTWHTALGDMGLNDMNGRIQDAVTGRFLSADPYVPDPTNTQSYNRYSYVMNNPLTRMDPSGFNDITDPHVSGPLAFQVPTINVCGNCTRYDPFKSFVAMQGVQALIQAQMQAANQQAQMAMAQAAAAAAAAQAAALGARPPTSLDKGDEKEKEKEPVPHRYEITTPTTCSADDAFHSLKAPGVSAPSAPPAQEGTTPRNLTPLVPGSFFRGWLPGYLTHPNPINQVVNTSERTLVNITLEGHAFHPGTVTTTVTENGTGSVIHTVGYGTGDHSGLNNFVGGAFFGIRNYLIQTGCDAANGIPNN